MQGYCSKYSSSNCQRCSTPNASSADEAGTDADCGRRLAQQLALQKLQLQAAKNSIIRNSRKAVGICRHIREAHIPRHLRDERVRDRALLLHPHRVPGAQALRIARQRGRFRFLHFFLLFYWNIEKIVYICSVLLY